MLRYRINEPLAFPGSRDRDDVGVAGDLGQQAVARRHFGKMDVRLDAHPLKCLQTVAGKHVVEKLGRGIGVIRQATALGRGRGERGMLHDCLGPLHQLRSHTTGRHLLAEILLILGSKHSVDPRQQGSDRQSHEPSPVDWSPPPD